MAEKNTPVGFYSELLSPSELFAVRARSHKIPVRGQKEFYPNDSEEQQRRLQHSLDEHWALVSEERVERLGNVVKAVWIPSEQIVELQSPAGKFWQTMGFSANGKQCLQPEEALYLMECGNVQVYYRDLPLSIQDGYERFLSSTAMSLPRYQVFGHLKRLGYVVSRFDSSSGPSSYERQLNLPSSRDRGAKLRKRKRSPSPSPSPAATSARATPSPSRTEEQAEPVTDKSEEDKPISGDVNEVQTPDSPAKPFDTESGEARSSGADDSAERSWWQGDTGPDAEQDPGASSWSVAAPRWDFCSIRFPDLGSRRSPSGRLASPDPSLLPGALQVGACDVVPWLRRLNLRKERMSGRERRRKQQRRGRRWDGDGDREVQHCRSWTEYKELQERRRRRRLSKRPAHLWEAAVTPLHDPTQVIPYAELLEKISVVKSCDSLERVPRFKCSEEWSISFNVYQADTVAEFRKSSPGKPYSRMCVCSFDGPVPDLSVVKVLASQSGDVPVTFAVVDHGDISFYNFKDFHLPNDAAHCS